ncbi:hypothetical protein L0P88_09805 [Muricauda sp. SCSIO 64092]|uniref:phage head spike fiber domain-containing protein n=1 Tax=Allomuricauda sp. SCSIO 64092 TaxID=2908842 RepID=UPI001FF3811E|nr:hypothetical protein [Muricauda sp. SCSIO 64092]UOY08830.1 hypothetical protein L0P88_09805 [Muricauda sp. SCSIO 64092]
MRFFLTKTTLILFVLSCGEDKKSTIETNIHTGTTSINLLEYTEDFSDMVWTREDVIVEDNCVESPEIRPSADLIDLTKNKKSRIYQMIPELDQGYYVFSIYIKAIRGQEGTFPITAFSKGKNGEYNNKLVKINSQVWTRAIVRVSQDSMGDIVVYPGNGMVKGATLKKAYIWGAQLERLDSLTENPKPYSGRNIIE